MHDKEIIFNAAGESVRNDFLTDNQNCWRNFTNQCEIVPYGYTISSIKYYLEYMKERCDSVFDISHFIRNNGQIVGAWTLQVRKNNELWEIGSNYSSIVEPIFIKGLSSKTKKNLIKHCIDWLVNLSEKLNIKELAINSLPYGNGADVWHRIWMEKGACISRVDHMCYVDLELSMDDIKQRIRRRYKDYIKTCERLWEISIIDSYDPVLFASYKKLHHDIAGRATRGDATWNEQLKALSNNEAFLILVFDKKKSIVGAAYFFKSNYECYYLSGAYNRSLFNNPLSHIVQYAAIKYCKEHGLKYYKLGDRAYNGDFVKHTPKELSISEFKEGFITNLFFSFEMRYHNE